LISNNQNKTLKYRAFTRYFLLIILLDEVKKQHSKEMPNY